MADALEALNEIDVRIAALTDAASSGRSKYLPSFAVQPITRAIAKTYFEAVRSELQIVQNRAKLTDEIDFSVQGLLQLGAGQSEKQAYLAHVSELRPRLLEATVDLMKSRGTPRLVLSDTERSILETLAALLPSTAASYEQAMRDISQGKRVSWRGTANELREVLRDVIDHLAPDDKVVAVAGFQLEQGQTRPTQKQKVRFVLRARRSAGAAMSGAASSLNIIDEAVAGLARSTYNRGSASTHTATSSKEIRNLKRYVDALLAELLEIA
jgi:hypothetical protein